MNLIAMYIKDAGPFSNQLISLDGDYVVLPGLNLSYKPCEKRPYQSIDQITAYVGENGSGKSTILHALSSLLKSDDSIEGELIWEIDGYYYSTNLNSAIRVDGETIETVPRSHFDYHNLPKNTSAIRYTPVYDPHSTQVESSRVKTLVSNIGSDHLYRFTRKKNREKDFELQFNFLVELKDFASANLGFDRFMDIDIEFNELRRVRQKIIRAICDSRMEYRPLRDLAASVFKVNVIVEDLREDHFELSAEDLRREFNRLYPEVFITRMQIYDDISFRMLAKVLHEEISLILKQEKVDKRRLADIKEIFVCALNLLTEPSPEWTDRWIQELLPLLSKRNKFFDYIKDIELAVTLVKEIAARSRHLPVTMSPQEGKRALSLISEIRQANLDKYGFSSSWRGMSSGQVAKLNLYARFFHVMQNINSKSIIIVMDEGDIYLHPEWQRKFLHEFSSFLSLVKGESRIKLIISTHSPLMISDLFRQDVFIVSKNGKNSEVRVSPNETFGASIYDLYKEDFVIQRSKGELAFDEIAKIIKEARRSTPANRQKVLATRIDRIGDKLLRIGISNIGASNVEHKSKV